MNEIILIIACFGAGWWFGYLHGAVDALAGVLRFVSTGTTGRNLNPFLNKF